MKIRRLAAAVLSFVMLGSSTVFAQLTESLAADEYVTVNKSELKGYDSGRDIGKADNYQLNFEIPVSELSDIPFVDGRYCFRLDINNAKWDTVLTQNDMDFREDVFTDNLSNYYWDVSNYTVEGKFEEHYETSQYIKAYQEGRRYGKRALYTSNYPETVKFNYPLVFDVGSSGLITVDVYAYDGPSDYYKSVDSDYKLIGSVDVAYVADGKFNVSCTRKEIGSEGTLNPLKFNDTNYMSIPEGTQFTVSLNSGYVFTEEPTLTAEGKFEGLCELEMDSVNKNTLHLTVTEDTPQGTGSITIDNLQVSGGRSNALIMSVSDQHGYSNRNLNVASYNAELDEEESSEETTEAATETTTQTVAAEETVVEIPLGQSYYTLNGAPVGMDSPAFINNGYTMLPLRAVAGIIGISDINYNVETKTAVLEYNGTRLEVTAGSDKIYINGVETAVDTPAVISNNRLYLPMRATAEAFGFDNIEFDSVNKTVRIIID